MTDPKELAKAVALEGLRNDTAVYTAIQYLGLDFSNPNMLQETFGDALRPEVIHVHTPDIPVTGRDYAAMALDPSAPLGPASNPGSGRWVRPIRVMERPLIRSSAKPPPAMTEDRKFFIDWMEKRIPDSDPRVKAMLMKGMRGE
jgi:hypothetical protein